MCVVAKHIAYKFALQAFLMLVAFGTWDRRRVARLAESADSKRDGFVEGAQARASTGLTVPWLGLGGIGGDRFGAILHPKARLALRLRFGRLPGRCAHWTSSRYRFTGSWPRRTRRIRVTSRA